jgi:hypothetical protein
MKKYVDPSDSERYQLSFKLKPGQEFGYIVENGKAFAKGVESPAWEMVDPLVDFNKWCKEMPLGSP